MRMIGSVGRVDQHELRSGTFREDDWPKLVDAVGKLNEAQLFIDDTAGGDGGSGGSGGLFFGDGGDGGTGGTGAAGGA